MPTRPIATKIVSRLQEAGFIAYFAGGWVRDYIMHRPSDDIDIATNAPVETIQELFPKTIPVGIAFGIIIVVEDGHPFEVATFRKDRDYRDGRRPEGFDPATPEEDATRRDFTINGMFFDPLTDTLYDFVGGKEDIQAGLIRAIGDPHARFGEDRLRMMRAVRYATRFDFQIDPNTRQAILDHASTLFPAVAMERIWQEFKKMSRFAHFDQGLLELHRLHLLPTIFPQLRDVSIEELQKRVAPLAYFPKDAPAIAELLELFPDMSLEETLDLCEYLKLSREEKTCAEEIHSAFALFTMPNAWQESLELYEWALFYAKTHTHLCLEIFAARLPPSERETWLATHHKRIAKLAMSIERLSERNPIVQAQDLLAAGIPSGPQMGKLLKEAERISVNHSLTTKDAILHHLQTLAIWTKPSLS